jgi:hypothetical protein
MAENSRFSVQFSAFLAHAAAQTKNLHGPTGVLDVRLCGFIGKNTNLTTL